MQHISGIKPKREIANMHSFRILATTHLIRNEISLWCMWNQLWKEFHRVFVLLKVDTQLEQITVALASTEDNATRAELQKLQEDLKSLVTLTEESLLSLKKSLLLAQLEKSNPSPSSSRTQETLPSVSNAENDMDAEFAAWQAAVADEPDETCDAGSSQPSDSPDSPACSQQEDEESSELSEIVGTKCRVPFKSEWGGSQYHNAIIVEVEPMVAECDPKVRVLFCNPTQKSMLPCQYFLESKCKFSEDQCRYSHGYQTLVAELQEYEEPDHSELKLESKCLACYEEDGLWYKATVVEVMEGQQFKVMFDAYNNTETVNVEHILPLESDEEEEDDRDSNDEAENDLPVFLWRPSQTTDSFGEWEQHTKGVGSRLMAKMGYIAGQGLGKNGEGRAEPVPIQLLPAGKSLDKIMELKEKAGDRDLYDVMKRQKRKQKKVNNAASEGYKKVKPDSHEVFDFINKKLGEKKEHVKDFLRVHPKTSQNRHISKKDLNKKSDREINVQVYKTQAEIKNVERELMRTRQTLRRNDGDKVTSSKVQAKVTSLENYLGQLKSSEQSLKRHQTGRSDKKKLTVF